MKDLIAYPQMETYVEKERCAAFQVRSHLCIHVSQTMIVQDVNYRCGCKTNEAH